VVLRGAPGFEVRAMSRERPILFSGAMVRAILAGRKTMTRRVVPIGWRGRRAGIEFVGGRGMEDDPESWGYADEYGDYYTLANGDPLYVIPCPYGQRGDRLWVRETWAAHGDYVAYRADGEDAGTRWRPSIFMPRWASRITLEVTGVRVERLQAITEEDARAEGVEPAMYAESWSAYDPTTEGYPTFFAEPEAGRYENVRHHPAKPMETTLEAFRRLWNEINGKRAPWDSNPWVWVVSFRRCAESAQEGAA
jgi:hypothetical protein